MHKFMHTYMHTYMQSGRGRRSGSVRVPTRHTVDTDAVQRCARAHTLYLHTSMHTHPFRPPSICIHAYLHTCMHTYEHMHTFMHASMHTEEAPRTEHPLTDGRYWDQIQDCRRRGPSYAYHYPWCVSVSMCAYVSVSVSVSVSECVRTYVCKHVRMFVSVLCVCM